MCLIWSHLLVRCSVQAEVKAGRQAGREGIQRRTMFVRSDQCHALNPCTCDPMVADCHYRTTGTSHMQRSPACTRGTVCVCTA